jgi:hypothetical protein
MYAAGRGAILLQSTSTSSLIKSESSSICSQVICPPANKRALDVLQIIKEKMITKEILKSRFFNII